MVHILYIYTRAFPADYIHSVASMHINLSFAFGICAFYSNWRFPETQRCEQQTCPDRYFLLCVRKCEINSSGSLIRVRILKCHNLDTVLACPHPPPTIHTHTHTPLYIHPNRDSPDIIILVLHLSVYIIIKYIYYVYQWFNIILLL